MAKVEEAKDTPSAKVLDAPRLPERPDWPPRLWFGVGGALLGFLFGACCIVGAERWAGIGPDHPYKALLDQEILPSVRARAVAVRQTFLRVLSRIRPASEC